MKTLDRVPVLVVTLIARLKRMLQPQGKKVLKVYGEDRYYVVDVKAGVVVHEAANMDVIGREFGVLKPWECVGS